MATCFLWRAHSESLAVVAKRTTCCPPERGQSVHVCSVPVEVKHSLSKREPEKCGMKQLSGLFRLKPVDYLIKNCPSFEEK